jgi:hypothetical protein
VIKYIEDKNERKIKMFISGLSCSYCGGKLEALRIVEGVIHTKCVCCHTVSEPSPPAVVKKPQIDSDIRPENVRHFSKLNKISGTFSKVEVMQKPKKATFWKNDKKCM